MGRSAFSFCILARHLPEEKGNDETNALTQGALGYRVDASSQLPKHALSCDRLRRATERYFGSDDAGNTHRVRRNPPFRKW